VLCVLQNRVSREDFVTVAVSSMTICLSLLSWNCVMESVGENFGTLFTARAVFVALSLDDDQMFGFKKWVILVTHH